MKRVTHMVSGAALGAAVCSVSGGTAPGLILLGALFGIAPDLDVHLEVFARGRVHRSRATHSIFAAILFGSIWVAAVSAEPWLTGTDMLSTVSLGYSTATVFLSVLIHAAEDALTLYGCRLLYPFSGRIYKGPVRYDDLITNSLLVMLSLVVIAVSLSVNLSSATG